MAKYQVMYWKHIPAQVKAWDERGEAKRMLPDRFQAAIDAYAMKDGSTEMDAYLEAWAWSDAQERPGSADEVADALVRELDADNPRMKLMNPHAGNPATLTDPPAGNPATLTDQQTNQEGR